MLLSVTIPIIIKIAGIILLGFVLNKARIISSETEKGLSNILLTAILPINILESSLEEADRPTTMMALIATCIIVV